MEATCAGLCEGFLEFPDLRKRYRGRHFWGRGYFSTTSGNITDDVILQYRNKPRFVSTEP
jgi:REP element-mobilizing transposase RayT